MSDIDFVKQRDFIVSIVTWCLTKERCSLCPLDLLVLLCDDPITIEAQTA